MPKLRWDCSRRGCFNEVKRPKIEVFDECFARGCAFGDVDGVVETNGHFLFLEWKEPGAPVPIGQRILHQRLTEASDRITIAIVNGDAHTMEVCAVSFVHLGRFYPPRPCDLTGLKALFRGWFERKDE